MSREHSAEVILLHAEAERFYLQAAREHLAGDVERAAVTRSFAKAALRRYARRRLPSVARSLCTADVREAGDAAFDAQIEKGDVRAWETALREAGHAEALS